MLVYMLMFLQSAGGASDRVLQSSVREPEISRAAALVQLLQLARQTGLPESQLLAKFTEFQNAKPPAGTNADFVGELLKANPNLQELANTNSELKTKLDEIAKSLGSSPPTPAQTAPPPASSDQVRVPNPPPPPATDASPPRPANVSPTSDGPDRETMIARAPGNENRIDEETLREMLKQQRHYEQTAGLLNQTIGPLEQMPALNQVVSEFIKGVKPGTADSPYSRLTKMVRPEDLKAAGGWLSEQLKGLSDDAKAARQTAREFGGLRVGLPSADVVPSASSGLVLVGLVAAAGFAWWLLSRKRSARANPIRSIRGWPKAGPIVTTREELVRAVDQISVAWLGQGAAHWHHRAVAEGLVRQNPVELESVHKLADLYELARYAPAGEPFPVEELPIARATLSRLAVRR